ncbi:MAG TPA: hypothetical protein VGM53_29840 [Streptosporangiaceae bacterium]
MSADPGGGTAAASGSITGEQEGAAANHPVFEPVLAELSERHRDEVLAAFAAVEHSPEPVPEIQLAALRDATMRRSVDALLARVGRTLIPLGEQASASGGPAWTSGYRDETAAELAAAGWHSLPAIDRAVLVLVLVHSVAIARSRGTLPGDTWTSAQPTMLAELQDTSRIQPTDMRSALQRLRAAGLVQLVPQRAGAGQSSAYLPGPQLHRLTPAARRRLQEQLILAAAPSSPLAAAIRARNTTTGGRPA